jgi:hypothetical protein
MKKPKKSTNGRPQVYPWEQWFNGQTWQLYRDKTYTCSDRSMMKSIRSAASRLGKHISIKATPQGLQISPRKQPDPSTAKMVPA